MFTEIDVSLNGKIITPGTDTYPYKAYLEKLLTYKPSRLKPDACGKKIPRDIWMM